MDPYTGPYAGRGPRRIYGERIEARAIPERYLRQTSVEHEIETRTYQLEARHKTIAQPLNVVVIVKANVKTQAVAHVILFRNFLKSLPKPSVLSTLEGYAKQDIQKRCD